MTLDKQKRQYVFVCDRCYVSLETKTTDFREAVDIMKAEGWRAAKHEDDYDHYCPDCG